MATSVNIGSVFGTVDLKNNLAKPAAQAKGQISDLERSVKSSVANINTSLSRVGSGMSRVGGVLDGVFTGITTAIGALVGATAVFGIQGAANIESTRIAFETILKDVEKAKNLMQELSVFAAETPFEFPELADAAKKLLAFGVAAEDIQSTLRSLGDIASLLNIPLGEISDIYGKIRVQGRAFAEDINQLQGRGIPVVQELSKQFGVTGEEIRAMVEEGKIGFPEIDSALRSMTNQGTIAGHAVSDITNEIKLLGKDGKLSIAGIDKLMEKNVDIAGLLAESYGKTRDEIVDMASKGKINLKEVNQVLSENAEGAGAFANGMAKQSQSFNGLMSTVSDNLKGFAREVIGISSDGEIRKGSIFFYLKNGVDSLVRQETIDRLENFKQRVIEIVEGITEAILNGDFSKIAEAFNISEDAPPIPFLEKLRAKIGDIAELASKYAKEIALITGAFTGIFIALKVLSPVLTIAVGLFEIVSGVAGVLGGAIATLSGAIATSGLGAFLATVSLVAIQIGLVVGVLALLAKGFKDAYNESEGFRDTIDRIGKAIGDLPSKIDDAKAAFMNLIDPLIPLFNELVSVFNTVSGLISVIFLALSAGLTGDGSQATDAVGIAKRLGLSEEDANFVVTTIQNLGSDIAKFVEFAKGLFQSLTPIFETIATFVVQILIPIIDQAKKSIVESFKAMLKIYEENREAIDILIKVVLAVIAVVLILAAAIVGTVVVAIGAVIFIIIKLVEVLLTANAKIEETKAKMLAFAVELAGFIYNKIKEFADKFISAFNSIKDGLKNAVDGAWNALMSALDGWKNNIYNWGKNIGTSFVDGVISGFSALKNAVKRILDDAKSIIKGNSPPKDGPWQNIDHWGYNVGQAWVEGLKEGINFGVPEMSAPELSTMSSPLSRSDAGAQNVFNYTANFEGIFTGDEADVRLLSRKVYDGLKSIAKANGTELKLLGEPSIGEA